MNLNLDIRFFIQTKLDCFNPARGHIANSLKILYSLFMFENLRIYRPVFIPSSIITVLFFLVIILSTQGFAEEVTQKPFEYFKTNSLPKSLSVYVEMNEERIIKSLNFKDQVYNHKDCEKIINYRARFLMNKNIQINLEMFNDEKTFNLLNRKTKFTKIDDYFFSAVRPSFPFDIDFKLKVNVQKSPIDNRAGNPILKEMHSFFKPVFILSQTMNNYNRFFTHTDFHIALFEVSKGIYLVEIFGNLGLRSSLPDFVQNKIKNEYDKKLIHFSKVFPMIW